MRGIRSVLGPRRSGRLARLAAAAAIAAGAGCFSDRGVAIEVDVRASGASTVELFLGKTACDGNDNAAGIDCKAIAPPAGAIAMRGEIWFRDDLAVEAAQVTGHTATFRLRSDTADTIPLVLAVGEDASGAGIAVATLTDLPIPIHGGR